MSKLSFRARALDPSKQMPIYLAEELPDLPEYSAINRAVPQMPSGMEKEEESEHHLQRAICTGLIIPTPEVFTTDQTFYDNSYPPNYKMPRQMIHMQPLGLEQDVPDYDMDSADEAWVNQQTRRLDLTPLKFEQMMDRLEKSSGQTVVTLNEAKALLKQDDEVSIAVYDYWLNKRLKMQHPLILTVKTENRSGASSNNPYLAFRRRTEKMQTRKNRKNDETSYEKMLKLRRDLHRATTVLDMVKRREKTKREQLHLSIEIFEKRVQLRDFSGALMSELSASLKNSRPAFTQIIMNQYSHHSSSAASTPTGHIGSALSAGGIPTGVGGGILSPGLIAVGGSNTITAGGHMYSSASQYLNSSSLAIDPINAGGGNGNRKEKRQYKKRKHKLPRDKQQHQQQQQYLASVGVVPTSAVSGAGAATGAGPSSLSAHHHHAHLHHMHRQSSSPAANESNIETEEEEYGGGGNGCHAQKMGSESEEETPFAFRRKQNCDYLRPTAHAGNWPWESKEGSYGLDSDTKYRFTLTSIRHPRTRCIGFARRRLGRGGRVILDRAETNLDEFWSQLDYTIFESESSSIARMKRIKNKFVKPASPPTVVDLPSAETALATSTKNAIPPSLIPASAIKVEVDEKLASAIVANESTKLTSKIIVENNKIDFDDEEEHYGDDDSDEEAYYAALRRDANIMHDAHYVSALTLLRQRRRRRHRERRVNDDKNITEAKHHKFNTTANAQIGVPSMSIPRQLLYQLAQTLDRSMNNSINRCLLSERVKREKLSGDDISDEVVELVHQQQQQQQQRQNHRSTNNNSNVLNSYNNNNNNSSSNINKNVSVSDKFNVIKNRASAPATPTTTTMETFVVESITDRESDSSVLGRKIKQELIDAVSIASADDSNEPLSSIRQSVTTTEILDDEDNVNLAQLSSLIRHTVKKEPLESNVSSTPNVSSTRLLNLKADSCSDEETPLNCVHDVIRLRNMYNRAESSTTSGNKRKGIVLSGYTANDDAAGDLSPTSSQRLEVCNELLSEIRRDWLHFRPKTPTDDDLFEDSNAYKLELPESLVEWSQQSPISVEMLRVGEEDATAHEKKNAAFTNLWDAHSDDALFVSGSFKYADLEPDAQLLESSFAADAIRGSSKSPVGAAGNSNSGIDFNLSGDSLNDINLLGEGDETDENMLDNILQECQIDDIKTLNQATNFWNGILDGEEVGTDVEAAAGLLDCIDEKKTKDGKRCATRNKCGKTRSGCPPVGSSNFNLSTTADALRDDKFFSKMKLKMEIKVDAIKVEPSEEILTAPQQRTQPTRGEISQNNTTIPAQLLQPVINLQQQFMGSISQPPLILTQTQSQQNQQKVSEVAAVSEIMTESSVVVPASQPHMQQQKLQQPQQQTFQLPQPQPRNSSVQQLQQMQQLEQQQQQKQQQMHQRQQQLLLQMHRDLASTPVITQYVPNSSAGGSTATTIRQQPMLTPIGATSSGNHMIYTTTSADGVSGSQKIYIQKAPQTVAAAPASSGGATASQLAMATQVPSNLGANAVITLSNVKLENDGTQTATVVGAPQAANILTIDGNTIAVSSVGTTTPNVSIISSGQQMAVHSISGMPHHMSASGSGTQISTTTTPLIVTTASRNTQQLTQQQLVHAQPTQQIVWRQIGATNATGGTEASGNKIVWTSRPGQKRQLNGPDEINKLLLNRKFSQRKIISQQQIQITKQELHQLQQQQQQQHQHQDDDNTSNVVHDAKSNSISGTATVAPTTTTSTMSHQLQKVQMQGGKVIKMSPFPLIVSELNVQQHQQQQLQQKQNSAAAIAANHNYSLQPTAIITSQSSQHMANKIYLTSSGGTSGITTANELHAATAIGSTTTQLTTTGGNSNAVMQKIHYKDLQNSNVKVNFVSTTGTGNALHQNQQLQGQQQQHHIVLNKTSTTTTTTTASTVNMQQQQQYQHLLQHQQKLKRERILNIIGATSVEATNSTNNVAVGGGGILTQENSKRVLYTNVLNVKPLQKNNAGQMQIGLGGMGHALLRGRIGNNQAVFTNMRPLSMATAISNAQVQVQVATSSAAAVAVANVNAATAIGTTAANATTDAAGTLTVNELKSIESVVAATVAITNNNGNNTAAANNSSTTTNSNSNSNNPTNNSTSTNNTAASATTINR